MEKSHQGNGSSQMLFETSDISLTFLASWFSLLLKELCRTNQSEQATFTLARCVQRGVSRLQDHLNSAEHKILFESLRPTMEKLNHGTKQIIDNCIKTQESQARESICKQALPSWEFKDFTTSITTAQNNIASELAMVQSLFNDFFLPTNIYKFEEITPIFSAVHGFISMKEKHQVVRYGMRSHQLEHIADVVKQSVNIDIMDSLLRVIPKLFDSVQALIDNEDGVDILEEDRDMLLQDGMLEIIYQALVMDDPWSIPMTMKDAAYGCGLSDKQLQYYVTKKHPNARRGTGHRFQFNTSYEDLRRLKSFDLHAHRTEKKAQKKQRKQS